MMSRFTNPFTAWRRRLVGDLAGEILEVGAGTGQNFPYYRHATVVHAIEPNPARARQAKTTAAAAMHCSGIPIHVKVAPAEALPYPDDHFDVVVSSLVFCSVTDQQQALAEVERVLRPAGTLWMMEHVRPRAPVFAGLAAAVTPVWRQLAHNCHLDRPTLAVLRQAGWQIDVLRRWGVFVKVRATKP